MYLILYFALTVGSRDDVDFHVFLEEFVQSQSHQTVAATSRPIGFARRPPRIIVSDRRQCADCMNELPKVNGFERVVCRDERIILVFIYFTVKTPRKNNRRTVIIIIYDVSINKYKHIKYSLKRSV